VRYTVEGGVINTGIIKKCFDTVDAGANMKIKIFCRCSLFRSWSWKGLISTPVYIYIY
jgi:hypothetical protein